MIIVFLKNSIKSFEIFVKLGNLIGQLIFDVLYLVKYFGLTLKYSKILELLIFFSISFSLMFNILVYILFNSISVSSELLILLLYIYNSLTPEYLFCKTENDVS